MGRQTPTLRMLLLIANTLRFRTSGPPNNQPTTHEATISTTMAPIPYVPINLIADDLYLPASSAAIMKTTIDNLPNHKPSFADCLGISTRSEERRVGKECRSRWSADQ